MVERSPLSIVISPEFTIQIQKIAFMENKLIVYSSFRNVNESIYAIITCPIVAYISGMGV